MTTDDLQQRLSTWLVEDGEHRVPDHLEAVLVQTATTRQRPAWASLERWLPMDLTAGTRTLTTPAMARTVRLLVVGLLIVALIGIALASAGSRQRVPAPFGLAANGALLSASGGDIYIATSPQSARTPLITGPEEDYGPWHSHDGTRFIFWRDVAPERQLMMIANADGSGLRALTEEPLTRADWFEWSPDDTRVVIVHSSGVRRVVSVVDTTSGAIVELAIPDLDIDNSLYWRPPSGAELIFTAQPSYGIQGAAGIYAMQPDGTKVRPIATGRPDGEGFHDLDLSPDGQTLAYWTEETVAGSATPQPRVHFINMVTLQDRTMRFDDTATGEFQLRFSPDGRTAVLVRRNARVQLAVVTVAGDAPPRLVGSAYAGDEQLTTMFSPDARTYVLAFEAPRRPVLVDLASGTETSLSETWNSYGSWQRRAP